MKTMKKLLLTAAALALAAALLLLGVTAVLYEKIFQRRFEADDKPLALAMSDFPGLSARPVTFQSSGELLRGNFYTSSSAADTKNALLIFCHGISNGSRDYLSQIDFFAEHGYEVLAYDNTGCYDSTGDGIRGIPQGVINLKDVLNTLMGDEAFAPYHQKPLILLGHSWGGYTVNAVLNERTYETVKAVVSFSAPNKSLDMLVEQGRLLFGDSIDLLKPFIWIVERMKFGKYAGYSALDGVNQTSAQVLILHSKDDPVVSFASSLAAQEPKILNPNASFFITEDRAHNTGLTEAAREYSKSLESLVEAKAQGSRLSVDELERLLADADKLLLYQLDSQVWETVLQTIQAATA